MERVTIDDLAMYIHHRTGISIASAKIALQTIYKTIGDTLVTGEVVKLEPFGTFRKIHQQDVNIAGAVHKKKAYIKFKQSNKLQL